MTVCNVEDTISVMSGVHTEKSVLKPSQDICFLGKRKNSKEMFIYLRKQRKKL